jgi:hypothetical protein
MLFLIFMPAVIITFWVVALRCALFCVVNVMLIHSPPPTRLRFADYALECPDAHGFLPSVQAYFLYSPWIFWLMINGGFHTIWVTGLLFMQMKQLLISNMTTNEEMNKCVTVAFSVVCF